MLDTRATDEAEPLERILLNQQVAIQKHIQRIVLPFAETKGERQLQQFRKHAKHAEAHFRKIQVKMECEPYDLLKLFEVELCRSEPVGLVYLMPETR